MKRILCMVMALMLCITVMAVPANAYVGKVEDDYIKYKVVGGYLYFEVASCSSDGDNIKIEEVLLTGADESISGKIIIPKEIQGGRVTRIYDGAFAYCNKMTGIEIPESIEDMEEIYDYGGFGYCDKLESINVDSNNKKYSSDNGVLLNKEKPKYCYAPKLKKASIQCLIL